ncbi:hypothetical protein BO86DRAFT_380240 [Aspergillus japonicus CBS 114.51]|uniref:Uncharacterized protein n=1 Tax=Aspergillus japonicus CBS 114.51 TaxID=1448312 RepID=A0A8T8WZC8_ASPJA|nr:hypothetical protein BO86DRAFT_380240 [Aspergillus japonicus CBS 114.51]RAH80752.1 hypothetical protein BO86DRAFT_380240 [Aspergillus japonicus CBS 114.51]
MKVADPDTNDVVPSQCMGNRPSQTEDTRRLKRVPSGPRRSRWKPPRDDWAGHLVSRVLREARHTILEAVNIITVWSGGAGVFSEKPVNVWKALRGTVPKSVMPCCTSTSNVKSDGARPSWHHPVGCGTGVLHAFAHSGHLSTIALFAIPSAAPDSTWGLAISRLGMPGLPTILDSATPSRVMPAMPLALSP